MKVRLMYVAMAALMMAGSQMTLSAQEQPNRDKQEQQNKGKKEKRQRPTPEQMMKMQVAQVTRRLMLDDETTAKFVPVYENFLKELNEVREAGRPQPKADANKEVTARKVQETAPEPGPDFDAEDAPVLMAVGPERDLKDSEVAELLKRQFEQSRKILDIREKYYAEFSKILSQKQIFQIYQQERSNAGKFRQEFDRRKGQGPARQGKQPDFGQQPDNA